MHVNGRNDPRFAAVADAFAANFASGGEVGAALAVYVDGLCVVDLWGGLVAKHGAKPWQEDTMVVTFSATKGATALCAHVLQQRGQLDFSAPVAKYWPEFAAAGKADIPVRMLLNHQAGLAAIDEPLPPQALFDQSQMATALAAQTPNWEPGSAHGYHAVTFGFLLGELVRRVSGRTLGAFFRDEIARPLRLDYWIGLPAELESRLATIRMAPMQPTPSPLFRRLADRDSLTSKAFLNPRGVLSPGQANSRTLHAAEIPAGNGIGTARALARMYAALANGGELEGHRLLQPEAVDLMSGVESDGDDLVLLVPTRFSTGFMKSVDNGARDSVRFGSNIEAFGHVGAGGCFGMADPTAKVAIGYVMNQLGPGTFLNQRGQSLIDATYACLV